MRIGLARTLFAVACVGAACGTTRFPPDSTLRLPVDVPSLFRMERDSGDVRCAAVALDPRTGHRLPLVRSKTGRGDYNVPSGSYGAGADDLLRISCASGRAIGLVPR